VIFWIVCAVVEAVTRPAGTRFCIMWNTVRGVSILLVCFLAAALALTSASSVSSAQGRTPRYVIYYNSNASPPEALIGTPYTHVILSFITVEPGAPDEGPVSLVVPGKLAPALAVIGRLQAEGKRVLISFGGGDMQLTDYTGLVGREELLADAIAAFVFVHGFDGVDIDFEVSAALHSRRRPGVLDGRPSRLSRRRVQRASAAAKGLVRSRLSVAGSIRSKVRRADGLAVLDSDAG
jgi:hypothetical protein